ncbi:MAG: hypothetical protein KGY61_10480 [Desulfobacterales bacterium]|nr:hypothetical protein [Desulfobacterales bacterium]
MKKIVPLVIMLLFFAVPALAGQVAVIDHQIEWVGSSDQYSIYHWEVDVNNAKDRLQKIHLRILLHNQDDYIINTMYHTVYLQGNQRRTFCGNSHVDCQSSEVKTSTAEIINSRPITH